MAYGILQSTSENDYIKKMMKLFAKYQVVYAHLKKINEVKKATKGRKKVDTEQSSICQPNKKDKLTLKIERIWDLKTIEKLLKAVFE